MQSYSLFDDLDLTLGMLGKRYFYKLSAHWKGKRKETEEKYSFQRAPAWEHKPDSSLCGRCTTLLQETGVCRPATERQQNWTREGRILFLTASLREEPIRGPTATMRGGNFQSITINGRPLILPPSYSWVGQTTRTLYLLMALSQRNNGRVKQT